MTQLRQRLLQDLQLRRYAQRSQKMYVRAVLQLPTRVIEDSDMPAWPSIDILAVCVRIYKLNQTLERFL